MRPSPASASSRMPEGSGSRDRAAPRSSPRRARVRRGGSGAAVVLTVLALAAMPHVNAADRPLQPPMPPLPPGELFAPAGTLLEAVAADPPAAGVVPVAGVVPPLVVADEEPLADAAVPEPAATKPAATEPAATEPVATEPVAKEPAAVTEVAAQGGRRAEPLRREGRSPQAAAAAGSACGDQAKDCREALQALRDDGIDSIALDIRVGGRPGSDYPCECRLEGESFQPRRFATTMMTWKAAGYCHKPLYFEDWNLERYGHSHGPLDPVFSAAHFFVTLPVLPYKMGVELPWECVYPLGYYRPGSCAPWTVPAVPISCRGFAVEAATVTGLVFLLP